MRVYQFAPANFAIQNLEHRRLKVATFEDLNDPFELLAARLPNRKLRKVFKGFKGHIHQTIGILCFCPSWENPLMWSHYADKHRGICLGFDMPEELAIRVKYIDARMAVSAEAQLGRASVGDQFAFDLMTSKYEGWVYEREIRMYVGLDECHTDAGLYFYAFGSNLKVRELILGPRCNMQLAKTRKLAKSIDPDIRVTKARLAFQTFTVVPDQRSVRKQPIIVA
jgi:hypothetical protein